VTIFGAISYSVLFIGFALALSSPLWILMLFSWLESREERLKQEVRS